MSKKLKVTIASVGQQLYDDNAISVSVPGSEGEMQILANHEPFISTLQKGKIVVEDIEGKKQEFELDGGVLEVSGNHATILVS